MRRAVGACCLLAFSGCRPGELPGEAVGTYEIVGSLVENTCGRTALPARDPLEFGVELRDSGGSGIWIVGKPPGFSGALSPQGDFRFTAESQYVAIEAGATMMEPEEVGDFLSLEPARPVEVPGCTLIIREVIDGRAVRTLSSSADAGLGRDAAAADLEADNTIEVAPAAGSDCLKALQAGGGPFLALPCQARYELIGTLADQP